MEGGGSDDIYPECKHIPRTCPQEITYENALQMVGNENENESVLPLFERKISNHKRVLLCSLQTNEMLKCRWQAYVKNNEGMKHYPFEFPDLGDLHFHNCEIKFMPSLTPKNRPNLRIHMGMGPGVDEYGQIPIPNDMHVSKSNITKTKPFESSKANQQKTATARGHEYAKATRAFLERQRRKVKK